MEVLLKKSKITTGILAQALTASVTDLRYSEVLGWCMYKKLKQHSRYIVLYNSKTNELRKYLMFDELTTEHDHSSNPFSVKVYFGVHYNSLWYQTADDSESTELIKVLEKVKQQALTAGQFYI